MCIILMYNLFYIYEDILNFFVLDNIWCVVFERVVKEYVKKLYNGKGIEIIFVYVEVIREYLKLVEMKKEFSLGRYDFLLVSLTKIKKIK